MTAEQPAVTQHFYFEVAPNVWGLKDKFVNIYIVQDTASGKWVLVDTGIKSTGKKIKKMAAELFDENNQKPKAIILTHGHFDHVSSVQQLAEEWHVPVYAHYLEMPYLTGKSHYPPFDTTVGGGLMTEISFLYPNSPINISSFITGLPDNNTVPNLPGWKWIHTPGHAPGHISLFREEDKLLIAGDAFVTTKSESAFSTAMQTEVVSRPPAYATTDWVAAYNSVKTLLLLQPEIAATGHGKPMRGNTMLKQLLDLYEHFDEAIPDKGRYVNEPAIQDANGLLYVPPATENQYKNIIYISSALLFVAAVFVASSKMKKKQRWL